MHFTRCTLICCSNRKLVVSLGEKLQKRTFERTEPIAKLHLKQITISVKLIWVWQQSSVCSALIFFGIIEEIIWKKEKFSREAIFTFTVKVGFGKNIFVCKRVNKLSRRVNTSSEKDFTPYFYISPTSSPLKKLSCFFTPLQTSWLVWIK